MNEQCHGCKPLDLSHDDNDEKTTILWIVVAFLMVFGIFMGGMAYFYP